MATLASWPTRVVSSYCTGPVPCISSPSSIADSLASVNAFSITSYYISTAGSIQPCSDSYSACNWSVGNVSESSASLQASTGALAQPLVFSNSGDMVASFRALVARPRGIETACGVLRAHAVRFRFSRIQLDLEPSCWAKNASACEWPVRRDALDFVLFVNATAAALGAVGAKLSVAVAAWPESQCTAAQHSTCSDAGESGYSAGCISGGWDVATCNCCAYLHFYDARALCASRAATIVSMDTYMTAPANLTFFAEAIRWYHEQGCAPSRLAVGLLADEAASPREAAELVATAK